MPLKRILILALNFLLFLHSGYGQYDLSPSHPAIDSLLKLADDSVLISSGCTYKYIEHANTIADSLSIIPDKIDVLLAFGNYYSGQKIFHTAIKYFLDALQLAEDNDLPQKKAKIYCMMGHNYTEIKQYAQATVLMNNAFTHAIQDTNYLLITQILIGIGKIHYELGDYQKSLEQYQLALTYESKLSNHRFIMIAYRGLGTVYYYLKDYKLALEYYERATSLCLTHDYLRDLGSIYTLIAHLYQSQSDYQSAQLYNRKALETRKKIGFPEHIASSYINIGNLYLETHILDSANWYLEKGINLLSNSPDFSLKTYAFHRYLNCLIEQKKFKQAAQVGMLYHTAYDSLLAINRLGEINRIENNYRIAEMEKQNALLVKEVEIQKLRLKNKEYLDFILQLTIMAFYLLIILFVYLQERNNKARRQLEEINRQLDREIQERKHKEILLRESEQLYRFLTNNTLDVIIRMDRQLNYLFISPSMEQMFGYKPSDPASFPALDKLIHADFLDEMGMQYRNMIRQRNPITFTHLALHKDGSTFWAESLMNPIFDEQTNRLRETITVIRDVSERIAFEEALQKSADQNQLLLREIHHRVKNNFAILISLMNLQKRRISPDATDKMFADLQQRIRTMSLVHEMLYRSKDISSIILGDYLRKLTEIISASYQNTNVNFTHQLERCILDIETALPIALIVNELLTNAYKHAFSHVPRGLLWIGLEREKDPLTHQPTDVYRLEIRDNGPGLADKTNLDSDGSMGSYLISMLVDQICGKLEYENRSGACFTITFPLRTD